MPTEIAVALISAVAIVSAAVLPAILIQSLRKENSEDHQYVRRVLTRVERKLDNHLEDHDNGVTRRNKTKH
jgi:type II secretory pathway component PulJ